MFSFIGFVGVFGILLGVWYWIEQRKSNWKQGMIITIASILLCIAGFGLQTLYPVIFAEQIAKQEQERQNVSEERELKRSKETELKEGIEEILTNKHNAYKSYVFLDDGELSISGYFNTHKGFDYYQELNKSILIKIKHSSVVDNVDISWTAPVMNFYGNKEETIVMDLDIPMDEVNKVNFANFDLNNLKYLSNFYSYTNEDGDVVEAISNRE